MMKIALFSVALMASCKDSRVDELRRQLDEMERGDKELRVKLDAKQDSLIKVLAFEGITGDDGKPIAEWWCNATDCTLFKQFCEVGSGGPCRQLPFVYCRLTTRINPEWALPWNCSASRRECEQKSASAPTPCMMVH